MKIDHVAIRTFHLEKLKAFYEHYFNGVSGEKYINPRKNFESFFITFEDGAKLELIEIDDEASKNKPDTRHVGMVHLAFSVGDKEKVDQLTDKLRNDGFTITGEPRTTGDGFYESVILDPDGNSIEITS